MCFPSSSIFKVGGVGLPSLSKAKVILMSEGRLASIFTQLTAGDGRVPSLDNGFHPMI